MLDGERKPRSPYAKYGKKPFRYSENYRQWHELTLARGTTDTPEHERLNRAHRRAFDIPEPKGHHGNAWV